MAFEKASNKENSNIQKVLNSVVLGYAAEFIGFEKDAWINTVKTTVPQKTVEINVKAFLSGYAAEH